MAETPLGDEIDRLRAEKKEMLETLKELIAAKEKKTAIEWLDALTNVAAKAEGIIAKAEGGTVAVDYEGNRR